MKNSIIFIFLFFSSPFFADGQDSRIINYTVEDGLVNNTVYYSVQDSQGFMWFCTESGVSRFDGTNWDNYTLDDGLVDNENFKCYEDSKKRIWFLSTNGRFCYFLQGKIYKVALAKTQQKTEVGMLYDCIEDKKSNRIYFMSSLRKLFYYDELKKEIRLDSHSDNNFILAKYKDEIYTFADAGNGRWMEMKAMSLSNPGKSESITPSAGESKKEYYIQKKYYINNSIPVAGRNNRLFYLSNMGVFQIVHGKISIFLSLKNLPGTKSIVMLYKYKNDLYFGGSGGIYKAENAFDTKKVNPKLFIGNIQANNLSVDKSGNFWISTYNKGIYFYPKNQANSTNIELFDQNEMMETYSISKISKNKLLVGLLNNTIAEIDSKNKISYRLLAENDKRFNKVKSIVNKDENTFYITDNIFHIEKTKSGKVVFNYQNYYNTLKNYCFDQYGNVWLITSSFIQKYDLRKNQISDSIYFPKRGSSIACDQQNSLYAGTKQGLFKRTDNKAFVSLNNTSPLFEVGINSLVYTGQNLWVSTHGCGIVVLKNDKAIKVFNKKNGLISNVCYRIVDGEDHIFVCTSIGLSIINKKTFEITNLTVSDGLISNDVKDVSFDEAGKIYLATNKGISMLFWKQTQKSVASPSPYLRVFQVNDSIFKNSPSNLSFVYSPGLLSLQFAAITFFSPQLVNYRYRIKGEHKWQLSTSGNITFYNLAPGSYSIELQAKHYKSDWSKSIVASFNILPLWYQKTSVKILFSLLLFSICILFVFWRVKRIRKRDQEKHVLEIRMNELERRTLAAQMNPHFIFNSLNTLQQLVLDQETETALNYLNDFAVLVRQILSNSRKPVIAIHEELEFLKNYLLVEKVRYNADFNFEFKMEEGLDEMITIPPMLVQPIVENAIKYGVSTAIRFPEISIAVSQKQDYLVFEIKDNGAGFEKVQQMQSKNQLIKSNALEIIKERLELIEVNHLKGSLEIESFNQPGKQGTIVKIKIPI